MATRRHGAFEELLPTFWMHTLTHTHMHPPTYTHTQVDLVEIKQAFLGAYQKQLSTFVKGDTSGDYRKVLLAVIGDEPASAGEQQSTSWFGGKDKGSSDELAYLRQQLALKEQELAAKNKDLAAKMAELAAISKTLSVKEGELVSKDQVLTTKTEELSVTSTQLTTTEGELAAQKEETAAKAREVDAKEQELITLRKELASKDDTIHMLETTITTLRSQTTVVSDYASFCYMLTWTQ